MEALIDMDDEALNKVIESCTEEELDTVYGILEAISEKDKAILNRGYKVGTGNNIMKDVKAAGIITDDKRFFTKKNLKNIAGDLKVDVTRIKNNLMGNSSEVSDILDTNARKKIKDKHDAAVKDEIQRYKDTKNDIKKFNAIRMDKAKQTENIRNNEIKNSLEQYKLAKSNGSASDIAAARNNVRQKLQNKREFLSDDPSITGKHRGGYAYNKDMVSNKVNEAIKNNNESHRKTLTDINTSRKNDEKQYELHSMKKFNDSSLSTKAAPTVNTVLNIGKSIANQSTKLGNKIKSSTVGKIGAVTSNRKNA